MKYGSAIVSLLGHDVDLAGIMRSVDGAVVTIASGDRRGSGFFVHPDGYIITNNHVMRENEATVKFRDGRTIPAELVNFNEYRDVAVLKTSSGNNYHFLELGDISKCRPGDRVLGIGSPRGLADTATQGIISAIRPLREFNSEARENLKIIQTDVALNPGSSGGPLLNSSGQVIAINTGHLAIGINLALAIDEALPVMNYRASPQRLAERLERIEQTARRKLEQDQQNSRAGAAYQEAKRAAQIQIAKERYKFNVSRCELLVLQELGFDPRTYNASEKAQDDNRQFRTMLYRDWPDKLTHQQVREAEYHIATNYRERLAYHNEKKRNGIAMYNYRMRLCGTTSN